MEDKMSGRIRFPETISIFAVGIAVGAALGVLFAPKSGEETREFIAGGAREGLDRVTSKGKDWARTAQKTVDNLKDRVRDAADAGERAFDEARRA
jgi:gas vesicle protein